ncbi:hypothetical protein KU306_06040 [Haloferax larsenii]|uniref:AAA+ ATPase domain-containing protein n=1 Tax=Haloferax larsenii TaxID=302484 RepID=A0ABY5RGD9_HALLR|nr:ATP-binding protein [Haloferax larsenii]UVE51436.1 hypothetical protein KU306_06040 [Haloferax larsenii]
MSSRKQGDSAVYAAAQGREFLRGALRDKSNEWIREFAGMIDDPDVLDFLNKYCSIYEERGLNFLDTHVGRHIVRSAATSMTDRAYREGNVSQLQGMVGLTNQKRDGSEAIVEAAKRLADEGAIYLVLGPPGAGKTAFALDVARVFGSLTGGTVLANVAWDGADKITTSSGSMLDAMGSTDGQVLQVIDEAGQSLTSRGAEAAVTDEFVKSLKYVRKKEDGDKYAKRGSVLLIGHTRKDTAAEIRRLASGAFVKPTRNDPGRVVFLDSEGGADSFEEAAEFTGVTDTREKYDEHEASHFSVTLDDDGDEQDDSPDPTQIAWEKDVATAIKACKPWDEENGMSYPDAAELVPYKDSWVGNRVREWKRGDHRDIVSAPEGDSA